MNWHKKTQQEWQQEIISGDFDVFGTLKFNDGRSIGTTDAENLWRNYWRDIDRIHYGHAASKGLRIGRWCFEEKGASEDNLHMHFVAKAPYDTKVFCAILNALWVTTSDRAASLQYNHITPIEDKAKVASYVAKDTGKFWQGAAGLSCSHKNEAAIHTGELHAEAQIMRIKNSISDQLLIQAYDEASNQIEWARKNLAHRQQAHRILYQASTRS